MKIISTFLLLLVFSIPTFSLRPVQEWLITFNDGETIIVKAETIDEAVIVFRREIKRATITGAVLRTDIDSQFTR